MLFLAGQASAADSWNKVESSHFTVVGEVSHGRLRSVARTLEQFRQATTRMFPSRSLTAARPLTIVVVDKKTMKSFVDSDNIAGFYRRAGDHDYIVMRSDATSGTDVRTTLHEYQHLITNASWQSLPRWVDEGIAEFYSTFQDVDGGKRYHIGLVVSEHLRTLNTDMPVPLQRFLAEDGGSMSMDERIRVGVFYAQSWALIHFFAFGDEGKWSATFAPFVEALASGMPGPDAFRRTVTPDLEGFDARFRRYLKNPTFTYARVVPEPIEEKAGASDTGRLTAAETETIKAALTKTSAQAGKTGG